MATMFTKCNNFLGLILFLTYVRGSPFQTPYCNSVLAGEQAGDSVKKVVHSHHSYDVINIGEEMGCPDGVSGVEAYGCHREQFNLTVSQDLEFLYLNRNDSDLPIDIFLMLKAYCVAELTQDIENATETTYDYYETTTSIVNKEDENSIRRVMDEAQTGVLRAQEDVENAVKKLLKAEKAEAKIQKRLEQANLSIQSAEKSVVVAQKSVYEAQQFVDKINKQYTY